MIPALISPTDGSIYVDGMEVTDTSADIAALRKKIGFIFQYPEQQLFAKNVYEDVVFGPRNVGISEVEAEKRAYEAIQFVGLPQDVYDLPMDKLSGGQKRRAAIAGVIAMQPDYLILDEPLAGLDPVGKKKMLQILRALHRDAGITVVVVSHDADAVVEDAEQVLYLRDGKILEQGAPSNVFYRLWLREMEHMTSDKHSKMNGEQMRDRSTGRLSEDTLAEALCELPVCMQLLIRLRIMGCSYAFSAFMDCTIAANRGLGKSFVPTVIVIMGSCVFRIIWVYTVFAYFHTIESLYLLYIVSWAITAAAEMICLRRVYREQMQKLPPDIDGVKVTA